MPKKLTAKTDDSECATSEPFRYKSATKTGVTIGACKIRVRNHINSKDS